MRDDTASHADPAELHHTPYVQSNSCSPNDEAVRVRTYAVQLFQVAPWDDSSPEFTPGCFPLQPALDRVRQLDPAADEYRHRDGLFGNERFCLVDAIGPMPLIVAYTKDVTAAPEVESKGEVRLLQLEEGEGLVDAAYAMVFPCDVVAILRTSPKAPGAVFLGNWLSEMGGTNFWLQPLPNPGVLAQVGGAPGLIRKFRLAGRPPTELAKERQDGLAAQLRREAGQYPGQMEGVLERSNRAHKWRRAFADQFNDDLFELMELLPHLREAKVWLTGRKGALDLKGAHFTIPTVTGLNEHKRVTARLAAKALMEMYEHEQKPINVSVEQLRSYRQRRRPSRARSSHESVD